MTRIAIVDSQPAVRAGLTVVLLEHRLLDGGGLTLCRRLKALVPAPRVILYTADPDGDIVLLARVACADGIVDKAAEPQELFEAIRVVARGGAALPALGL